MTDPANAKDSQDELDFDEDELDEDFDSVRALAKQIQSTIQANLDEKT